MTYQYLPINSRLTLSVWQRGREREDKRDRREGQDKRQKIITIIIKPKEALGGRRKEKKQQQ